MATLTLQPIPFGFSKLIESQAPIFGTVPSYHRRSSSLSRRNRAARPDQDERDASPSKPSSHTSDEWRNGLARAKRLHASGQHHQCFALCQDFLRAAAQSHQTNVEPAHVIYFHFYAASALEAQAHQAHQASSNRSRLLVKAREHYQHASVLVNAEEATHARPSRRAACHTPELHSPTSSMSSRSTISSRAPSPDMFAPYPYAGRPLSKHQKRVSFQEEVVVFEPIIRPDSPTLGFEEWLGGSPQEAPTPRLSLRVENLPPAPPPPPFSPSSPTSSLLEPIEEEDEMEDPFALVRSVHRYCTILAALRRQIVSHVVSIEAELAASEKRRQSSLLDSEEMRALELRTRIERLRANGWQRPRFDAEKYRRLRDEAESDLAGSL